MSGREIFLEAFSLSMVNRKAFDNKAVLVYMSRLSVYWNAVKTALTTLRKEHKQNKVSLISIRRH